MVFPICFFVLLLLLIVVILMLFEKGILLVLVEIRNIKVAAELNLVQQVVK
jgi:hypothetical protein